MVGRYCHEKGYDHLLQAWSMIQNDCSDWTLTIFGEGDRTQYDKMIEKLHIERKRCILNPRTSDIESEFANSSFAVCSSRFEGFGLVIAEAMACGLPVVSFDCPWGPRSIISDGKNGMLVDNGNIKKLSEAILTMTQNSDAREQMGMNAREDIKRFNIDNIANKWKELFDNLY